MIYLKSAHENDGVYYAINETKIEDIAVSDSFGNCGQKVSSADAGDYIEIFTPWAAVVANETWNDENAEGEDFVERFTTGDNVSAYDHLFEFDAILEICEEGVDYNLVKEVLRGFTFWNGHNWETVSVDYEFGETTHEIEDDEETIAQLNDAIDNKEFISQGNGLTIYGFKDAEITESQYIDAWEIYSITLENDFMG